MSSLSDYFTSLANKMRSKTGKVATMTPTEMITEVDAVYQAGVNSIQTQTKTAPAVPDGLSVANNTIISPDSGKLLSGVTIPKAFGGDISDYFKVKTISQNMTTATKFTIKSLFPNAKNGEYYFITCVTKTLKMGIANQTGIEVIFQPILTCSDSLKAAPFIIFKVTNADSANIGIHTSIGQGARIDYILVKIADS